MTFIEGCYSYAVVVHQTGALCPMERETMPRAIRVDYAQNGPKTRISAQFCQLVQCPTVVLQCKTLEVSVTYCHELETNLRRSKDGRMSGRWSSSRSAPLCPPAWPSRSPAPASTRGGSPSEWSAPSGPPASGI